MNRRPPDVWAVFLLHQAEGGCAANFRYQAITRFENLAGQVNERYRDVTTTICLKAPNKASASANTNLRLRLILRGMTVSPACLRNA